MIASSPYHSLIAQAKNGSGKTGSFAIGSVMRVDRDDPAIQVICIVNVRELCNQIASVYEKIVMGTGITLLNTMNETKQTSAQIIVTTHGKLDKLLGGRKPLDLSKLKCIVVDEADVFFLDDKNHASLKKIAGNKAIKGNENIQWILFSATF